MKLESVEALGADTLRPCIGGVFFLSASSDRRSYSCVTAAIASENGLLAGKVYPLRCECIWC